MRWTEFRGLVAVAVTVVAIAISWTTIENWETERDAGVVVTASTTTTTTAPPTTTLSSEEKNLLICSMAREFADEANKLAIAPLAGVTIERALKFWKDVLDVAPVNARAEVVAVVNYYEDYIETAGPFAYDLERIIVDGDKEKLEQLITRPAPGFEDSRGFISFGCGLEVPSQPLMEADDFEDLEDRLLDENDR